MLLPTDIKTEIEKTVFAIQPESNSIIHIEPLSGGSINYSFKVTIGKSAYFLKWNYAKKYPNMLEAEAKGLELLRNTKTLYIPNIISQGKTGLFSYLLLEFIEEAITSDEFYDDFGKSLAQLHKNTSKQYGLEYDNYIGSLPQNNKQHGGWTSFFINERIEPQLKMARDNTLLTKENAKQFEKLFSVLDEIFPPEQPSLLHGDLWSGNYLKSKKGKATLIDPAVYFGHREMDIAMSKLFGGFNEEFYVGYNNAWPMEKGWEKRIDICNLYPLLVHLNLFGEGYTQQILQIIKPF